MRAAKAEGIVTFIQLDSDGLRMVAFEENERFRITRDFLSNRGAFLKRLFAR